MKFKLQDFGLSWPRITLFATVSMAAALAEGVGMITLLPVLEFIEKGRDAGALAGQSRLWEWIVGGYGMLGVDINLLSLLVVVLVVMLIRVALIYTRRIYTFWVTQDVLHSTRMNLFRAFLGARYSFFDMSPTGHMVNIITNETTRTGGYFTSIFGMGSNLLVVIGYCLVLLWISVSITLLGLLFLVCGGLLVSYYVRNTKHYSKKTYASNEKLSFLMIERLTAVRLIKLSAVLKREISYLTKASQKVRDNLFYLNKLNSRIELILEPLVVVSASILLYAGVDRFGLSLSEVGLFMLVLLRLLPVVKEVLRTRQTMLSQSASFHAVRDAIVEGRKQHEVTDRGCRKLTALNKGIVFENVSFTYPEGSQKALDGINLLIPSGKVTALVGQSGSGKSTLADLLPALRWPSEGQILLDDAPISEFDLLSLRRGIAFVSQDTAILNDTVYNNITFAKEDATREDVEAALKQAKADEFVRSLPEGIETHLGERGLKLSGGQRQRISLARAFVKNAPIMILDEPTSALDSAVERDIQKVLDELRAKGETTMIIIAHRLSTIQNADKIVVLSKGRIVEEGTHEQLTASKEWYSELYQIQKV